MLRPLILVPLLVLAACGRSADEGTSVTINADNEQVKGAVDGGSGAVKIDLPGFKGELKLPKIQLDADNFDLNGVHLYPGSTIDNIDVGSGDGLRLRFSSPADPQVVRDWFQGRLQAAGFTIRADGNGLVGETDEKKPFRMELAPDGAKAAHGTITLGG